MLFEDTRQQTHDGDKHAVKHEWWRVHGVEVCRKKLDFGDYSAQGSNVCVDTKRNIDELAQNLGRDHKRFTREMDRAADAGYRLVVLVENDLGFTSDADLVRWTATHCRKCRNFLTGRCMPMQASGRCAKHGTVKPLQGARLYKTALSTFFKHGAVLELCAPDESAQRICELLGVAWNE